MKRIGMIVAIPGELSALLKRYGEAEKEEKVGTMTLYTYHTETMDLFVMQTGAGEIAAAAGTQYLISVSGAEMILDYGIVGGLTKEMERCRTAIVNKVVHYDFDTSKIDGTLPGQYEEYPDAFIPMDETIIEKALKTVPELKPVTIASGDKFLTEQAEKEALFEAFGAEICDMEAAGVALTCNRNGIPCLMIKTVADSITGGPESYWAAKMEASTMAFGITEQIIREI